METITPLLGGYLPQCGLNSGSETTANKDSGKRVEEFSVEQQESLIGEGADTGFSTPSVRNTPLIIGELEVERVPVSQRRAASSELVNGNYVEKERGHGLLRDWDTHFGTHVYSVTILCSSAEVWDEGLKKKWKTRLRHQRPHELDSLFIFTFNFNLFLSQIFNMCCFTFNYWLHYDQSFSYIIFYHWQKFSNPTTLKC